jgi:hypothetical protein
MEITFTKTSLTHHTLRVVRKDGTTEEALLETRTFMPHDLIHYAYEKMAGRKHSFWGLVASGARLSDFDKEKVKELMKGNEEIRLTEMLTGWLHGYLTSNVTEDQAIAALANMLEANMIPLPPYITHDFIKDLKEYFFHLRGHWNAMAKNEEMKLIWEE